MEAPISEKPTDEADAQPTQATPATSESTSQDAATNPSKQKTKCSKSLKHKPKKSQKAKNTTVSPSESESDSSDDDSSDDETSESSSDSSSEEERQRRKERKRKASKKKKKQKARSKRSKRHESESDSDSDDDSSNSESESSEGERHKKKDKKRKRVRAVRDPSESDDSADTEASLGDGDQNLRAKLAALRLGRNARGQSGLGWTDYANLLGKGDGSKRKAKKQKKKKQGKRASTLGYKRVDQVYDSNIFNFKLKESAEAEEDEFDQYIFTVRRKFDGENKYRYTLVDIKSKFLRDALAEVMKDVKGVSLVEDRPSIDPNMLFLYLEELRTYAKKTLKAKAKAEKKRKAKKTIATTIAHCKVLIGYLDEDYEETKKTLAPMLEAGNITFDLLWALFKPNSLAYTTTYGSVEDPRCFKVDYANRENSIMRGEWYSIEGRYLEYDGKSFGLGDFEVQVDAFKGARKISGLATYPLKYHKDAEGIKAQLIERGKRFVALEGMNYRFHKGLAFMKKKKTVAKVNINGRIMIDPAIFRRINPNYPISLIKPKDPDELLDDDDEDSDCSSGCGCQDSDDSQEVGRQDHEDLGEEKDRERTRYKVIFDRDDKPHVVEVPVDDNGREVVAQTIDKLDDNAEPSTSATDPVDPQKKAIRRDFSEEELMIASPVVLGFAFSEKLWLEFSLSGVCDIEWNHGAFDSLVLPANQKSIVKALVESHKFHAAKTIDDVVQGKGKGLVAVLHGPPGTGKTLTAEGIAELLKCPLYMVSAGELGTDPRVLEHELQKILDIAHSWGAVLLLDEADVFLEKREVHDIHRNALVSIFLRLLEYFQGILFLTTNRVETFDDAFQSRIHVALRYGELTAKAKKAVWKMFLEKVRDMEGVETFAFRDADYETLARNNMNGRQIKNAVRTAQALAVNSKEKLSMIHIKLVLDVAQSFENDLKGGTGYMDAMRCYT